MVYNTSYGANGRGEITTIAQGVTLTDLLITSDNFCINTSSTGSGSGVLCLANARTIPTTNPSLGGILYISAGSLRYRGISGSVTILAPDWFL